MKKKSTPKKKTGKKVVKAWASAYLQDIYGGDGYILVRSISERQRDCRKYMAKVFSNHPTLWYELGWRRAKQANVRVIPITITYEL